ncbi:hypothetical protein JCM8547_000754 [Rhodosporidiobolus lusitaniae]
MERSSSSQQAPSSPPQNRADDSVLSSSPPSADGIRRSATRSFPLTRAAAGLPSTSAPIASNTPPLRPTLVSRSSARPSFISIPTSTGLPISEYGPREGDAFSPSGMTSVSSADGSTTSRHTGPDLGGSKSRYFPMRSVLYPSSDKPSGSSATAGSSRKTSSVTSTAAGTSSSIAAHASLSGPASRAEAPVGGAGSMEPSRDEANAGPSRPPAPSSAGSREDLEKAVGRLGMLPHARRSDDGRSGPERPGVTPRRSSDKTEQGRRRRRSRTSKTSSQTSSKQKPPSLDDLLPDPPSQAKQGGSDSDEANEAASRRQKQGSKRNDVEVQDFADEEADYAERRKDVLQDGERVVKAAGDASTNTFSSEKPLLMTTRFEHQMTDDGEILVLTGRDGELERCEDEPIHAPGAVQAFGVLIVFDQQEDGSMKVKQVSENSGFILGLPPRHLFRVSCFSDLFDDDEVEVLEDAIDALDDRDSDSAGEEDGPYNFTLSGRGIPGSGTSDAQTRERHEWTAHAAIHRPDKQKPERVVLELELVDDHLNPLTTESSEPFTPDERIGFADPEDYQGINPTEEDIAESTLSLIKPLRTLTRMKERQKKKGRKQSSRGLGDMDIVGLLSQINDQLSKADKLETFLKITAGIFRELTDFDRVMIYQFDESWNGRVVAEQVDYSRTKDLFRGLNFPASDIPAQARELYRINKVRLLYDRDQPTARLCCRSVDEVNSPLDMTHCHLRAMSPIHIKYLGNMGVRSSMSVSITAFGDLWGLVSMHTYGRYGHRISFPVRQLCKLLGQSISRNIERISYAQRLQARKLINTASSDQNPSGFIIAKAEDLLDLFHADFGILSIGDEAKILGPVNNSQELLAVLEYLRVKQFLDLRYSQDIKQDFPDIDYPEGFSLIAGLLCVPLSGEGKDFIVFFRKGQLQNVHWAGNPYANKTAGDYRPLEPRKSFKVWSETVVGKSVAWTDDERETASVLSLVYGKFIAVWREKESALAASQLTNLLLANASHEVRTPLNAIINYLELALDGPIQGEVRDNLVRSHAASKSLVHVINDLLDLTRTERGGELYLTDPFNLAETLQDALAVHREEAQHRGIALEVVENPTGTPPTVLGDRAKIRQIVTNVVANALKHTQEGSIVVEWGEVVDQNVEDALEAKQDSIRIGISVTDTGAGISEEKLENIFRQFEQVSTIGDKTRDEAAESQQAVGLGLAVVARIVRNLGGQLQVASTVGEGSRFTFTFPFRLPEAPSSGPGRSDTDGSGTGGTSVSTRTISEQAKRDPLVRRKSNGSAESRKSGASSGRSDIDNLINSIANQGPSTGNSRQRRTGGASSVSSASTNSGQTNPSFRTAASSLGCAGALLAGSSNDYSRSRAGVDVSGSKVPLRPARVGPSSGGDTNVSPLNSPPSLDKSPKSPFFTSPLSQPSPFTTSPLRRTSTRSLSNASKPLPSLPPPAQTEKADSEVVSGGETVVQNTPRPSSPKSGQAQASSNPAAVEDPKHISEYRKSPVLSDPDSIRPMRVLVVEDEMVNRMIISQRLKKDGHEVVVAEHGGVAVRKFEEDRDFDIVLMDLQMPILDGLGASRSIRKIEKESPIPRSEQRPSVQLNRGIPILAVTASLPERERNTIVDAKLNGWLLKPIDFKRLKTLMQGALDAKARAKEIYTPGQWERGGWLTTAPSSRRSRSGSHSSGSKMERADSLRETASGLAAMSLEEEGGESSDARSQA